jgi:hypothetical protein
MTISNLILQYAVLAAGLAASLFLFFSLKRELQMTLRRQHQHFEEIARRLEEAEEPLPQIEAPRAGFNLNKRVQAMRLLRRGEEVGHIAAALGVPRAEVELLIRVQQMSIASISAGEETASRAITVGDAR